MSTPGRSRFNEAGARKIRLGKQAMTQGNPSAFQIMLAVAAGLGLLTVNDVSPTTSGYFVPKARAIIGRPATPMSYAGVARRTTRREAYGTGAYGGYRGYGYGAPGRSAQRRWAQRPMARRPTAPATACRSLTSTVAS